MNERIEKAYAQRPKRWVFELSVAVIVTALIVWSATAVETSGTTQNGGKIALLGLQKADARINWEKVIFNGLTIRGIYGRKVWDTWYKMTTMLEAGLDISGIITHRMNIKDYKKGFDAMISGQSGKVILNWEDIDKLEAQSQDC